MMIYNSHLPFYFTKKDDGDNALFNLDNKDNNNDEKPKHVSKKRVPKKRLSRKEKMAALQEKRQAAVLGAGMVSSTCKDGSSKTKISANTEKGYDLEKVTIQVNTYKQKKVINISGEDAKAVKELLQKPKQADISKHTQIDGSMGWKYQRVLFQNHVYEEKKERLQNLN